MTMNEPSPRAERKTLEELRDKGILAGVVRVILAEINKGYAHLIGPTVLALLALSAPATAGEERGERLSHGITECLNAGGTSVTVATEKETVSICIPKGVISDYIAGWGQLLAPQAATGTPKGEMSLGEAADGIRKLRDLEEIGEDVRKLTEPVPEDGAEEEVTGYGERDRRALEGLADTVD